MAEDTAPMTAEERASAFLHGLRYGWDDEEEAVIHLMLTQAMHEAGAQARAEGYAAGRTDGYADGAADGHAEGTIFGETKGYAAGMEAAAGIADYGAKVSRESTYRPILAPVAINAAETIAAAIRAKAAEGAPAEKDDGWRTATEGMEWDKVPGRVQVWLEGSAFHSGHEWRRSIWGECRHKGFQWQVEDVERLRLIGDMEIYRVTHWRPYQGVPWPPGLAPHRDPAEPEEADHG